MRANYTVANVWYGNLRSCVASPMRLLSIMLPLLCFATQLHAAEGKHVQYSEGLFLFQIVLLVIVGRLLGEAMVRIGQPSIMGQIIGGILLGPSILGVILPDLQAHLFPEMESQQSMTEAVAQLGILFLLLLAGMETDLGLAYRMRNSALGISLAGISVPFACGFLLGQFMPENLLPSPNARLVASLFLGTALAISSVKIVASVVREMDFLRRNVGQLIVASAIIDDTIGWVVIAFTFSLARSGTIDPVSIGSAVFGTLAFLVLSFTIGRRLVFEAIRFTNDHFRSDLPVLSVIIAIMGGMAMITDMIGVHTVLGAFVAGILVGESPILTKQIDAQLRALTTALFMPVFFGLTGLKTDLGVLLNPETLLLTVGLIVIASVGKFGGAFVGAKFSGLTNAEAVALGSGMNARGSTEVIIATIGLAAGVLNEQLFSSIVAMALVTTMVMPPMLRWALSRLPLREDEEERLKKEEFDQASFVGRFERIMVAVDLSPSSELAARLAGYFALSRNTPVTVLNVREEEGEAEGDEAAEDGDKSQRSGKSRRDVDEFVDRISNAVTRKKTDEAQSETSNGKPIHVTGKQLDGVSLTDALGESAEKGHDLLFIGCEPVAGENAGFTDQIAAMESAFSGPVAIVAARDAGTLENSPERRILVPITDTERSVRAVEFACAVAKSMGAVVAAIFVVEPGQAALRPRFSAAANDHIASFARVDEIARHYEITISKTVQEGSSPEVAILRHARRGRYNLIVMGVSRRTSESLSYGRIADTILETSDRSVVLLETE